MQELPIGVQDFEMLRRDGLLYVDKTAQLLKLIKSGRRYFLSRPRRFGKSLTLSTLEAMFAGRVDLFEGLAAHSWVEEQSKRPYPVVRLDMSSIGSPETPAELKLAISNELKNIAEDHDVELQGDPACEWMLKNLIRVLSKKQGLVVVLIDEYDKFILDNIDDLAKAEEMRKVLRSFYGMLKSCDKYLRFIFITGISKFSKVGVFSAMNNLADISLNADYAAIVGYTQNELEENFTEWIDATAFKINVSHDEILNKLKDYYDGFSFDGKTRLYNPFSILNFFATGEFNNYWYESGSPAFIAKWMKDHQIQGPEEYRHIQVKSSFTSSQEIEKATPTSFLFQSGYLTIEKKEGQILTLDYPNREVLDSLSSIYLENIYHIEQFVSLGAKIWHHLKSGNISEIVNLYNIALAGVPYDDFPNRNEFWYRSLFLMLLRRAGIIAHAEVHTHKGRSDLLIQFENLVVILEFKFAKNSSEIPNKMAEGKRQMEDRDYAKSYNIEGLNIVTAVLVADDEKRQVISIVGGH